MRVISYRTRNFLIAGVLGVLAVALTLVYTASIRSNNNKTSSDSGPVAVLVATKDIPLGTAAASLGSTWVKTVNVPADQVASGAVKSRVALANQVAIQTTYKGEQLVAQRFGTTQQAGLVSQLHGTYRVFELAGDEHQVLAGTLKVGNRVDVVASVKVPEDGQTHLSTVAIRNLLVVDAPQKNSSVDNGANASVDLMVTTSQLQRLFWLQKNGDWSLVLRPSTKATDKVLPPSNAQSVVEGQ